MGNTKMGYRLEISRKVGSEPIIKKLAHLYEKFVSSIIAVEKCGIIRGKEIDENLFLGDNAVEKPSLHNAPSHIGIVGRYMLIPEIFFALKTIKLTKSKNIELTDAIQLLSEKEDIYVYKIQGKKYDSWDLEEYVKTVIDFALKTSKVEAKKDG